jgi:hypothetical protein
MVCKQWHVEDFHRCGESLLNGKNLNVFEGWTLGRARGRGVGADMCGKPKRADSQHRGGTGTAYLAFPSMVALVTPFRLGRPHFLWERSRSHILEENRV